VFAVNLAHIRSAVPEIFDSQTKWEKQTRYRQCSYAHLHAAIQS